MKIIVDSNISIVFSNKKAERALHSAFLLGKNTRNTEGSKRAAYTVYQIPMPSESTVSIRSEIPPRKPFRRQKANQQKENPFQIERVLRFRRDVHNWLHVRSRANRIGKRRDVFRCNGRAAELAAEGA